MGVTALHLSRGGKEKVRLCFLCFIKEEAQVYQLLTGKGERGALLLLLCYALYWSFRGV